ncbi:unnamed protein product, partial [Symbiodinium necroappetens]
NKNCHAEMALPVYDQELQLWRCKCRNTYASSGRKRQSTDVAWGGMPQTFAYYQYEKRRWAFCPGYDPVRRLDLFEQLRQRK